MRHTLLLGLILLPITVAISAPVPKDRESREKKIERLFGKPEIPEGCNLEIEGNTLKLTVPVLPAGKPGEAGVYESPRTARTVSGDFEMLVTVISEKPHDQTVDTWAGVYVGKDSKNHFDYMRWITVGRGPGTGRGVWSQLRTNDRQSHVVGHAEQDHTTATIRVIRRGNELKSHTRYGDDDWTQEVKTAVEFPNEVTVGVYVGGRQGPYAARFQDFKVRPVK